MRGHYLAACIAAAALLPLAASAQTSCERQQQNRVAGTVAGAGVGAVVGSQVSGRGSRTEGSVIGGLAGAIIGNLETPFAGATIPPPVTSASAFAGLVPNAAGLLKRTQTYLFAFGPLCR